MNRDFIAIRSMEGEIKLSHKKSAYGLTVTSKELVLQKPHMNYYLRLEDIISIMPVDPYGLKPLRTVQDGSEASGLVSVSPGTRHYRIMMQAAVIHNRSGLRQVRSCDFILPITDEMLRTIGRWAGLNELPGGTSSPDAIGGTESTGGAEA
ncbi:hypothetical protein [Gorillibacterium sp. sgz5001074]|uniref:hypothetical protein n=1 Tax=Gorillibacterium sp. sgz5001074 TaxID=3446695 RepID=UPI003F66C3E8